MAVFGVVAEAFYLGAGGSQAAGEWASMIQLGPIRSLAYFENGEMIYEASIDSRNLTAEPCYPPNTDKANEVHAAITTILSRCKQAREDKWKN